MKGAIGLYFYSRFLQKKKAMKFCKILKQRQVLLSNKGVFSLDKQQKVCGFLANTDTQLMGSEQYRTNELRKKIKILIISTT